MIDGIILLSKPTGTTSFQALGSIKRALDTGRVGHAGTLDRFASGLLIALAGKLTRLCPYVSDLEKEYVARITFGKGTDTLDPEGTVISEGAQPSEEELRHVLPEFHGTLMQVPPEYSAVHVEGRRAYVSARMGEEVRLSARPITVHGIELLEFDAPEAVLRIVCSKGTYIRSLARDVAARLGTCAFVSGLIRTRIGGFRLENAVPPQEFDPLRHMLPSWALFENSPHLMRLTARDEWTKRILLGVPVSPSSFEIPPVTDGTYGAFDSSGMLLAILEVCRGAIRYSAVLAEGEAG